ncbi:MAG: hypothetical protein SYR96_36115 [Actinomycetota bacterium]|nr:hypothetical protein [Actinomycetota bacterium]
MARYTFTRSDLARFTPLMRNQVVRSGLTNTVKVKKLAAEGRHIQRLTMAEPARSRDFDAGIDLRYVLAAVREVAPAVACVAYRGNGITVVISDRPPEPAEQEALVALLSDSERLQALEPPPPTPQELVDLLKSSLTPDDEWIRLFRRYADMTDLITDLP